MRLLKKRRRILMDYLFEEVETAKVITMPLPDKLIKWRLK